MKYYLCTFNPDYADEHNVPALACFTEEEYNVWLESPASKINKNYDEELKAFNNSVEKYDTFQKGLKARDLYTKPPANFTPEEKAWCDANYAPYMSSYGGPKKGDSYLRAWLGNSSDCFGESYDNYLFMKDFVADNTVQVTEVNESFYNFFHAVDMSGLSLCNIFECEVED